jgi:hypothetical protein
VLALCAGAALLVSGCASIPGSTLPQHADLQNGPVSPSVAGPPRNADPLSIVRDFIDNNGDPTNVHAAARGYLAKADQTTWNNGRQPSTVWIINDSFSTNYGDEPIVSPDLDDVDVNTTLVGTLNPDGSFTPPTLEEATAYGVSMQVHKQSDGQWRIVQPKPQLIMRQSDFERYYRQVSVDFFNQGWNALVPDLRYVVGDSVTLPGRVVQLLLGGPSAQLRDAVLDAVPPGATLKTNVTVTSNNEIDINLGGVQNLPNNTRSLMIAQIVGSLQAYGSSVAVDSEGVALVPGHQTWRAADLPPYLPYVGANAAGMVVSKGRIYNMSTGAPIVGPAGDGDYDVVTAAQSPDGQELATVTKRDDGTNELRIGRLKSTESTVKNLTGKAITRPTWEPGDATGDPSRALWTVVDGTVERVISSAQGTWLATTSVDASELQKYGSITDLRLSDDGVRVAVAAGGHLLIGSVVATGPGSVAIRQVQLVPSLTGVTKVDWPNQSQVVATTSQPGAPVQRVSADGEKIDAFSPANLTSTVTALAASQSGSVTVTDAAGMWTITDLTGYWSPAPHDQPAGAIPFYPG